MTLKCLLVSIEKMVTALINAVFIGQLKAKVNQPTLLKTMLDIFDMKDRMQDYSLCTFLLLFYSA